MEIAYWGIIILPILLFCLTVVFIYMQKYSERTPKISSGRRKKRRKKEKLNWDEFD